MPEGSREPSLLSIVTGCPPFLYSSRYISPFLRTSTTICVDSAFTTEEPTPCRPPETLYAELPNLPPACSIVYTTRIVATFFAGCISTGTPRPLSLIHIPPSFCIVICISLQKPASCSSMLLSRISQTRWCSPRGPVEPIYMPGRLRTASRPSNITISFPVYSLIKISILKLILRTNICIIYLFVCESKVENY